MLIHTFRQFPEMLALAALVVSGTLTYLGNRAYQPRPFDNVGAWA